LNVKGKEKMSNKLAVVIQELAEMQDKNEIISLPWINTKQVETCQK
jgi:hypothetical protein